MERFAGITELGIRPAAGVARTASGVAATSCSYWQPVTDVNLESIAAGGMFTGVTFTDVPKHRIRRPRGPS